MCKVSEIVLKSPLYTYGQFSSVIKCYFNKFLICSGPLEREVLGFCMIVHKLLTYHRILSFPRAEMSFITFLTIFVRCVEHLTPIAVQKALVRCI